MDFFVEMQKFNKRWSITSQTSYEMEFQKFKTRVLNIFDNIDDNLEDTELIKFCQYLGIRYDPRIRIIKKRLDQESDEKEFYRLLQVIMLLKIKTQYESGGPGGVFVTSSKKTIVESLKEAVNISSINLALIQKDEEIILLPRGEKILDEGLVDQVYSFLEGSAEGHFKDSLNLYQEKQHIKSAESLRRTIEEFLRTVFKNESNLKNNLRNLQDSLKNSGNASILNIVGQFFNYLDTYFNENSKHRDGQINEKENEFLIYQTCTLLRFLKQSLE